MRYLAFDIECSDGHHICEFGYVITDERFNLLKKELLIINPDAAFNLSGRPNQKDLELHFAEETYNSRKLFPEYYEKIKELIEAPDQIVVGHAINCDAGFLRTACLRYNLPPIDFEFFDSQRAYSEFANFRDNISLENANKNLNLDDSCCYHKSDDDALVTMKLVGSICSRLEVTLPELKILCPRACGESRCFEIRYNEDSLERLLNCLSTGSSFVSKEKKKKCLKLFEENTEPDGDAPPSPLYGKSVCFGKKFEEEHLKDTLVLIRLLAERNCKYKTKVSKCDYYIPDEEELAAKEPDLRMRYYVVLVHNIKGRKAVISLEKLLSMIGISKEELEKMPWPDYKEIKAEADARSRWNQSYYDDSESVSIGDIIRQKEASHADRRHKKQ